MPTYLCHGFRWHRMNILRHISRHDLDDAALHWIIAPRSKAQIIQSFEEMLDGSPSLGHADPETEAANAAEACQEDHEPLQDIAETEGLRASPHEEGREAEKRVDDTTIDHLAAQTSPLLPGITLLEEYDPDNLDTFAAPWAYVADYAVWVDGAISVPEQMRRFEQERSRGLVVETRSLVHGGEDLPSAAAKTNLLDFMTEGLEPQPSNSKGGYRSWLARLRDEVQGNECIDWYIVVCGDEIRDKSIASEESDSDED